MDVFSSINLSSWRQFTCAGCRRACRAAPGADISASLCSECEAVPAVVQLDPSREAGIPSRYRSGWGLEDWKRDFGALPGKLRSWNLEPQSVLAWGNTGTGKTGLLTILMQSLVEGHELTGFWIRGQALLDGLRGGIGLEGYEASKAEVTARQLVRRAQTCKVLLVDDLFAGAVRVGAKRQLEVTPWVKERLLAIFCSRFDDQALTLATTMLSPKQLGEVDMSLASRLAESIVVKFSGADRRLRS